MLDHHLTRDAEALLPGTGNASGTHGLMVGTSGTDPASDAQPIVEAIIFDRCCSNRCHRSQKYRSHRQTGLRFRIQFVYISCELIDTLTVTVQLRCNGIQFCLKQHVPFSHLLPCRQFQCSTIRSPQILDNGFCKIEVFDQHKIMVRKNFPYLDTIRGSDFLYWN